MFEYVYTVSGIENDSVDFGASLVNGYSIDASHLQSLNSTVTVKDVEIAEQAGVSIQSLGLFIKIFSDDLLILKDIAAEVPGGNFQMDPRAPFGTGTVITFDEGVTKQWFSTNATGDDMVIPAGIWNASLRYNSARLPDGMAADASIIHDTAVDGGGHTFHFNTDTTKARLDSGQMTGCTNLATDAGGGALSGATWSATGGVNGSGAYYFDGNDYIRIANSGSKKDCNFVDNQDASIAGWFKADIGGGNSQAIFSKYDTGEGGYEVSLENGNVAFTFIEVGAIDFVLCQTSGTDYRDEQWHHFAGMVEFGAKDCTLYVDDITPVTHQDGGLGHEHENEDPVYIGMRAGSTNGFEGYIDDIMMWNNYELSSSDVTALKGASFGSNAHEMTFVINNATGLGNTVDNLVTSTSYDLPYGDQMDHTDVSDLWAGFNYTASLPQVTLTTATPNRLNFTISFDSGMDMNLKINDGALDGITELMSTFLQPPKANVGFPSYLTFDNDDIEIDFFAYNSGAEGVWFTYQGTRLVFNGTNGSYASLIKSINGTALDQHTDSIYVGKNENADMIFWPPQNTPNATAPVESLKIPAGQYQATVFFNGYDDDGTNFVKSIKLGLVTATE